MYFGRLIRINIVVALLVRVEIGIDNVMQLSATVVLLFVFVVVQVIVIRAKHRLSTFTRSPQIDNIISI